MSLKTTILLSALALAFGDNSNTVDSGAATIPSIEEDIAVIDEEKEKDENKEIVISDADAKDDGTYKNPAAFRFCTKYLSYPYPEDEEKKEEKKDEKKDEKKKANDKKEDKSFTACRHEDEFNICITVPKGAEKIENSSTFVKEIPEKCAEDGDFAVVEVSEDSDKNVTGVESVTSFECVKGQAPANESTVKKEACNEEDDEQIHWIADIPSTIRDFSVCSKKGEECPKTEEDTKNQCIDFKKGTTEIEGLSLVDVVPERCSSGFSHLNLDEKKAIKALEFYHCNDENKPTLTNAIKNEECNADDANQHKWVSNAGSVSVAAAVLATLATAAAF